jgi:hypothetical protein
MKLESIDNLGPTLSFFIFYFLFFIFDTKRRQPLARREQNTPQAQRQAQSQHKQAGKEKTNKKN